MRVLVVNAGSSSLKLSLTGADDETLAERELAAPRAELDVAVVRRALAGELGRADVTAHRIVHGGERFHGPVRIDPGVREAIAALTDLAPLHQPKSLAALDTVGRILPDLPAVACFDTAFHSTLAPDAYTYALPKAWRERFGVRRFGFHGLSHAWVARRAPALLDLDPGAIRIVSCHLGAGASLCAIAGGALGGHNDGIHSARGPRHGHPVGQRGPRSHYLAARAHRAVRARGRARARARIRAARPVWHS